MRIADTHCHLDFDRFDEDREAVIARAQKAGVTRILVPGIDLESSKAAVALAEKVEMVYAAIGVHPNSATTWESRTRAGLEALSHHPKVAAVGEIGLDFYRDWSPKPLQRKVFKEQLALAAELGLPVVVHNRDAFEETVPLLLAWQDELARSGSPLAGKPGVLHSYSGNIMQAGEILTAGFCLGVTGPVTFKNAADLHEVVQRVPLDRLLIETDAPYLTPHPHRGARNEPAYVAFVAEKIADLRGISPLELGEQTSLNAKNLFDW